MAAKFDTVTLEQIRQIPGVTGVITTLYDTAPGEVWELDEDSCTEGRSRGQQDFIFRELKV